MNRWHCRICKTWGLGGPEGWTKHHKTQHVDNNRYGTALSFGFAPNYSDGNRGRYSASFRPPRLEDRT